MCLHDKRMLNNRTWHFDSHRSSQGLEHSCSQSFFVLEQCSRQQTALCKDVEWHILKQKCSQSSLDKHLLIQLPLKASLVKSFSTETLMSVSLCQEQHSARLDSILFKRSKMKSTSAHMRTGLELSKLSIMYISCCAQLSSTLMWLKVFKNSHFCFLLLWTKKTTMTFASSP